MHFKLQTKPFSVNQMSCRDARYKSAAFKDWYVKTRQLILASPQYPDLLIMAEDFQALKDPRLLMELHVTYPAGMFHNAQGSISSKTMDVSNFEKPLIDLIVGDLMHLNDKHVVKLISTKSPGAELCIDVHIELQEGAK